MKLEELVATRMKEVDALGKRMAAKPTAELAEKLSTETLAAHAGRIEMRIARLEGQRSAVLDRIDTALKTEQAALLAIRKMADAIPAARPGKEAQPGMTAPSPRAAPAAKAARTESPSAKAKVGKTLRARAPASKARAAKKK
jgi:hypothetical protein